MIRLLQGKSFQAEQRLESPTGGQFETSCVTDHFLHDGCIHPLKKRFLICTLVWTGPGGIRSRASCINHPVTCGWGRESSGALVLKGTGDTHPVPWFARALGTQPAFLHLHCKPGSKPVCAFVNVSLHQVEPTALVGKYKCPLHFYAADQRLAVQSFLGQHARGTLGSRASLKKAHPALSHVAFSEGQRRPLKGKRGPRARAWLLSFHTKTQEHIYL